MSVALTLPVQLMIDKVSILKNSNPLGNDVDGWEIFLFNLHKLANDYDNLEDNIKNLALEYDNSKLVCNKLSNNETLNCQFELPISLNRSNFPASLIKDNVTIRVYFKSNVVYSGMTDTDLKMSNVQLALRYKEVKKDNLMVLYKQPKLSHLFNKKLFSKIILNGLSSGKQYSLKIPSLNHIAGGVIIFITPFSNNISYSTLNNYWHILDKSIDNVYITDPTGRNINNSNNVISKDYNTYTILNHFKYFSNALKSLTNNNNNDGNLYYLSFCSDGSDSFNGQYSGGYNFKNSSDYSINFVSNSNYTGDLVLNLMWFCPSLIQLENKILNEYYS